ncbi:MAG: ATP-binding protein [Desulfobacca sp.]|nr:ATP-binding protein [Desulfobacca sp.]
MMTAPASKLQFASLAVEWERIGLLAHLLAESRQGRQATPELLARLQVLQGQVEENRRQGRGLIQAAALPLSGLELDVLAAVLAPEAEPRLGWIFQNLQAGLPQPYPTMALLQELLAISAAESAQFYVVLSEAARLRRLGLIEVEGGDPFQPVRPAPGVTARLLGRPLVTPELPGAILVKIQARWADLILPPDRLTMLNEFLLWITHKAKVIHEWGGQDCGGPVALFSGPSGTGKTFAAAVLATELGWPLYRVDLGRLVSKYIGETEKNLNRLFDAAEGQPMILQFDEADSLFSKRGEVKEARDRYANMEVSHLLARIESHHGPVILTTNLRKHLDPAFARRFQVVVDFPRPEAPARTLLWQRLLPPLAPGRTELDFAFLGQSVNLTGGQIRNAALHAAYLAAGDGQRLTFRNIALAVWRELGKDGRELSKTDLGALGNFLSEGG